MRISGALSVPVAGIEDPASCLLHAGGLLVLSLHAASLVRTGQRHDHRLALATFVASALICLGVSALYHVVPLEHPWKATAQRADHAMIFQIGRAHV